MNTEPELFQYISDFYNPDAGTLYAALEKRRIEAVSRNDAIALFNHRNMRSPAKPGGGLKRLFSTAPVREFSAHRLDQT